MAITIGGGNSAAGKANVSSTFELEVRTPQTERNAGFIQLSSEVDAGTITGTREVKALEATDDYRLRVGIDCPLFNHSFEGTVVATDRFNQSLSTMTTAQASGFLSINSGNATASGNYGIVTTRKAFPILGTYQTYCNMWVREANQTATNAVSEWGLGYAATTATPTDGMFFRRLSGGGLRAVVNFAGAETVATIDTTSVPGGDGSGAYDATERNHYLIDLHNDYANFWINDVLVASIATPSSQPTPTSSSEQPVFARVYNSGVASAGRRVEIGFITVEQGDANWGKPWAHTMAGMGGHSSQVQPGTAVAQTANWSNSAAPASASLSNTAAGYTSMGGQYQFAATATNETDWALFGYQNPAGSNALPGKTLYITEIRIGEMFVTGAAAVNATMFFWAVGIGSSAVSLATTDAATTVSPKRIALGGQGFLAAAAVGASAPGFLVTFQTPLPVHNGAFLHIILKQLNGAATASLVWRGTVTVNGYFA